jgi:signal transduction histidine kinase/DNA-binding response OmpR family regulator
VSGTILAVSVRTEHDVVMARQRARQLAALLGFDEQGQTRIATAVSEIARNAYEYAGGGKVEFLVEGQSAPQLFTVKVSDRGQGITDVAAVLEGRYRSTSGMGLGIVGARRLMDKFEIDSSPTGTNVWPRKLFPRRSAAVGLRDFAVIAEELCRREPATPLEEIQRQNQELLRTLDELRQRQDELGRVNRELEDTNRGVVALYAELDEKTDHLRRADEMKSRFLSNMSHEFRTPLNSILALSRLLLSHTDGVLTAEQERQVGYIRKAADDLTELVSDLLDLAKVEAGKAEVRPVEFDTRNLFGALRGMLRPLLVNESVALLFEEPEGLPPLHTDEAKVSQILRNFISNALKFTERGEIRVSARLGDRGRTVIFAVADSGIGIAHEDQARIFEQFVQVDNAVQRRVKGTGLGLPLTRKLAELLGGRVAVESTLGVGSTFCAEIPIEYVATARTDSLAPSEAWAAPQPGRVPVLIVEDDPLDALLYEKFLRDTPFQPVVTRGLREARQVLSRVRPHAVVLDIMLKGEDAWTFLAMFKAPAAQRGVPVLVVTSVEDEQKGLALGADAYRNKPIDRAWLLETLERVGNETRGRRVLIIDDDEIWRYLLHGWLAELGFQAPAAPDGAEGMRLARELRPDVIVLDLAMPVSGEEVLERLAEDAATRDIPVIIVTSQVLDDIKRARLLERAAAVLSKNALAREAAISEIRWALAAAGMEDLA